MVATKAQSLKKSWKGFPRPRAPWGAKIRNQSNFDRNQANFDSFPKVFLASNSVFDSFLALWGPGSERPRNLFRDFFQDLGWTGTKDPKKFQTEPPHFPNLLNLVLLSVFKEKNIGKRPPNPEILYICSFLGIPQRIDLANLGGVGVGVRNRRLH